MTTQPHPRALQDALDKMEIGEMQSRYMFALDWHDPAMYAALFTEDAVLEWPEGSAKGREAIYKACVNIGKFFDNLAAAAGPRKPFRLRHFVTNRVFDIQDDRARCWAYWLDLNNDNLQRWPYVAAYGYYEDDLVRTADGWRFTHRRIYNEMTGESPQENPLIARLTPAPEPGSS
ncbi:MAG TPA: nuclear transport factor 2 family protein [Steroidobacteraceae bacterium]|nr:nuclear transport factor 2 family protein [Steroidobacteraceae bacterium]